MLFEVLIDPAHIPVHGSDDAAVVPHVALVFPLIQGFPGKVVPLELRDDRVVVRIPDGLLLRVHPAFHGLAGSEVLPVQAAAVFLQPRLFRSMDLVFPVRHLQVVDDVHVGEDAHFLLGGGFAGGVVVIEGFRKREGDLVETPQVLQVRHPAAVRGLVVEEQAERFVGIPMLQPFEGHVRRDVRGIAGADDLFPVPDEYRVVVISLSGEDVPVIESRGIAHQVPFPDHRRLVSARLQQLRQCLLAAVEDAVLVVRETVGMTVLAGQQAGPGGSAQGICDKTVCEAGPFLGQTVDVGGPHEPLVIRAYGLVGVVVTHDVNDIQRLFGLFLCLGTGDCGRRGRSSCQHQKESGSVHYQPGFCCHLFPVSVRRRCWNGSR